MYAALFVRLNVKQSTSIWHKLQAISSVKHGLNYISRPQHVGRPVKAKQLGLGEYSLLTIPVITFCLGTWQIQRRQWKLNLIKELEEKTNATPIDFPFDLEELDGLEYRKVKLRGTFDHSKEIYVQPRSLLTHGEETGGGLISSSGQSGAHVITPFCLADRELVVLVNRGWVPRKKLNPNTRREAQVEREIDLVGVIRHTEPRAPFVPHNDTKGNFWYHRDIDAMAAKCGTIPVFLDADFASTIEGGPIGGQTRVSLRNEHFSYIITWYALCAATSFMWYKRYIRGLSVL